MKICLVQYIQIFDYYRSLKIEYIDPYCWIFAQRIDINIRTQLLKSQKLRLDFDEITSTIFSLQTKTLPKAQLNLYGLLCRHVPDKMQNV